jgi:hypothetical protein
MGQSLTTHQIIIIGEPKSLKKYRIIKYKLCYWFRIRGGNR